MNFGITSSVELRSCVERAHELRREYIAQQLSVGVAALFSLIRGFLRPAAASVAGASTKPQRGSSIVMRTAGEG